jgi:hypothetical protein
MPSTTANYGWDKPTVGGDADAWGTELNSALDGIDTTVKGIDTRVTALEGGTFTGPVLLAHGNVALAAIFLNLDLSSYSVYKRLEIKLNKVNPGVSSTGMGLQFSSNGGTTFTTSGYKWMLATLGATYAFDSDTASSDGTRIKLQNILAIAHGTIEIAALSNGPIVKSNLSGIQTASYNTLHGAGSNPVAGSNALKLFFIGDVAASGTYDLIGYL